MPPWAALSPRLSVRAEKCILCLVRNDQRQYHTQRRRNALCFRRPKLSRARVDLSYRAVSTNVAPTAINAQADVPAANKELYVALSALERTAGRYGDGRRLTLALRGLEERNTGVRVALLGLNGSTGARKLARLLLADPLGPEEEWERRLVNGGMAAEAGDGAVLLRYGSESDADVGLTKPQYSTLIAPSRTLRTHNMEILVSTLDVNPPVAHATRTTTSPVDALLVLNLPDMTSSSGFTPFPVHKTLIVGEGLDSAIDFGRLSHDSTPSVQSLVKVAINLPASLEEDNPECQNGSVPVNVDVGTQALAKFRESIQNSDVYEHGWYRSGLPALTAWLVRDLGPSKFVRPAVLNLITALADDIERKVKEEDAARIQQMASEPTLSRVSASIITHLETWAEQAHSELRDDLDEAFAARNWHKLAWWKLLWRVDDVTMISSEIIERRWLVTAERGGTYLAGRMSQAGFPENIEIPFSSSITPEVPCAQMATEASTDVDLAPTTPPSSADLTPTDTILPCSPWPSLISTTRTTLLDTTIPPLQALAQRLLLQTFSTTSISTALSAFLYVCMSNFSVFEASAVAALGLTFSLRRMQNVWEEARSKWEGILREEGKATLRRCEVAVRELVKRRERQSEGRIEELDGGAETRRHVREALGQVRKAVEKIEGEVHGQTKDR